MFGLSAYPLSWQATEKRIKQVSHFWCKSINFRWICQYDSWEGVLLGKVLFKIGCLATLVQNSFFTTESQRAQRDNFYLAGRYRQIKSVLSLQNRDPTLCQSPVRRLRFYSRREGIYDPIAASRLDHKKSSSVYSVPPWWTWFQKGRMSSQKPNEINITSLAFELIWTAMSWFTNISFQERESLPPTTSNSSGLFLPAIRTGFKHALHERPLRSFPEAIQFDTVKFVVDCFLLKSLIDSFRYKV